MSELTDLDPIQPLTDPQDAPPIHTAEDVRRRWRSLMGAGVFGRDTLWATWYDSAGRQLPLVMPIDDIPRRFDQQMMTGLTQVLNAPADHGATTLALALSRPGPATVNRTDRHRALAISAALEQAHDHDHFGLQLWPICLATKNSVRILAADDLT